MTDPRVLCDFPGCPELATTITQAAGRNTPSKAWYACDRHRPVVLTDRQAPS